MQRRPRRNHTPAFKAKVAHIGSSAFELRFPRCVTPLPIRMAA